MDQAHRLENGEFEQRTCIVWCKQAAFSIQMWQDSNAGMESIQVHPEGGNETYEMDDY